MSSPRTQDTLRQRDTETGDPPVDDRTVTISQLRMLSVVTPLAITAAWLASAPLYVLTLASGWWLCEYRIRRGLVGRFWPTSRAVLALLGVYVVALFVAGWRVLR